jgi:hypothetical protein
VSSGFDALCSDGNETMEDPVCETIDRIDLRNIRFFDLMSSCSLIGECIRHKIASDAVLSGYAGQ